MTRKDYVAIARAIKDARPLALERRQAFPLSLVIAKDVLETVAANLADTLAADNPRCDRSRFLKACGVQS